jgi:mRNA interferase MazF
MTRGKVVLVPFPFDDLSGEKVRPAVCLTDPIGANRHVILSFISSQIPPEMVESDLLLHTTRPDFALTGLRVSSVLRLHRLMAVTTGLIRREMGMLSPQMQSEVADRLRRLFHLV